MLPKSLPSKIMQSVAVQVVMVSGKRGKASHSRDGPMRTQADLMILLGTDTLDTDTARWICAPLRHGCFTRTAPASV